MIARPQSSKVGPILLTLVVVVAVLEVAQDVLMPLALAFLFAFLLSPVVAWLERHGLGRAVSVVITTFVAFALAVGLLFVVVNQFVGLVEDLPSYRDNLVHKIRSVSGAASGELERGAETVRELSDELQKVAPGKPDAPSIARVQIVEPPPNAMQVLRGYLGPLARPVGTGAIVLVFVIFVLLQREDLRDRFVRLLGAQRMHTTLIALDDAAERVSRYLLMQTLINGIQGTLVAIGLYLIGVPDALMWGALTIALRFIPYLGPLLAAIGPIVVGIAYFDDWGGTLVTIALIGTLELISNNVLEPWLYGSRVGVSSLALLVATVFWTWLWGTAGLFLATPLTVCLVVMGKYIPQLEFLSIMLSDQPVLQTHERFYQRLLADDPEEAEDLIEDASKELSLVEVCDRVLLPALRFAEQDHDRGAIDETRRSTIVDHIDAIVEDLPETHRRQHRATAKVAQGEDGAQAAGTAQPGEDGSAAGTPAAQVRAKLEFKVLCLPSGDRADEVAAQLFAGLLDPEGVQGHAASVTALKGEMLDLVTEMKPDAIFVSAVPPSAVLRARYLCKRLRARAPGIPIVVALWDAQGDLQKATDRLTSAGADRIVTSSATGLEEIRRLLQPVIQGVHRQ
jgi:predicted PurR-regulated permease PerM/CheY-like chemotaxis protein